MTIFLALVFSLNARAALIPPTVTDASIDVDTASVDDVSLKLKLEVENTNPKDVSIESVKAEVFIDGLDTIRADAKEKITLKARSKTRYTLPVKMPWKSALYISEKVLNKKPLPYRIKGSAKVEGKDTPFDHKGQLPSK